MRIARLPWPLVLAILALCATPLSAYEALSEEELDRTIASGVEPVQAVVQSGRSVSGNPIADEVTDGNGDSDPKLEMVAYRAVLPIVMHRMTGASTGPLGPHGNYSLSPLDGFGTRGLPVSPFILNGATLPPRSAFFGP